MSARYDLCLRCGVASYCFDDERCLMCGYSRRWCSLTDLIWTLALVALVVFGAAAWLVIR